MSEDSPLGTTYADGDVVVRQGDPGDCMYVVLGGTAEVIRETPDCDVRIGMLVEGDIFGEMALFDREVRSATVRAVGEVRMLRVDQRTFFSRVHEDPSLAIKVMQKMSRRIRELDEELTSYRTMQSE
jgi:CRP-like cAMP-binding protein